MTDVAVPGDRVIRYVSPRDDTGCYLRGGNRGHDLGQLDANECRDPAARASMCKLIVSVL